MNRHNAILVVLLITGVLGGLLVLQAPIHITPDSTKYLLGARFLSRGNGYIEIMDGDFVIYNHRWPPAYSAFIALGIKAGLSEIQSARLVNFVAWCILLISWMAFFQRIFSPSWAVVAYFLTLLSWGLWISLSMILSEVLFVAFIGLVGWSLTVAMSSNEQSASIRTRWLVLGAFALMGVGLTRYAGLPIVIATGLAVLFGTELSKREKLRAFSILIAIGWGGNILWMLRNKFLTGQATLVTAESVVGGLSKVNLSYIPKFWRYLWREAIGTPYALADYLSHYVGWIFLLFLATIIIWYGRAHLKKLGFAFIWVILSVIFYFPLLLILQAEVSRYFWVLQPFAVTILVKVMTFLHRQVQGKPLFSIMRCCYVALAVILLLATVVRSRRSILAIQKPFHLDLVSDNAYFEPFRKSPWVFQWVKLNYRNGDLMFSNFPEFIYFVTNCPCWEVNWMEDAITKGIFQGRKNIYLILYKDNLWRTFYLLPWQEYCRIFPYQVIREDENAIIVQLKLTKPKKLGAQKPGITGNGNTRTPRGVQVDETLNCHAG